MSAAFDPYYEWLGIPPAEQPPSLYRLLGIEPFEMNARVIAQAADQQMVRLCVFQTGKQSATAKRLLNEVAAAKICLLSPPKKAAYDATLRAARGEPEPSCARRSGVLWAGAAAVLLVLGLACWAYFSLCSTLGQ